MFQENTDVQSYESIEIPKATGGKRETVHYRPIHPYILWLSNDQKQGEAFIKVDQLCIHVGCGKLSNILVAAAELLYMVHHTFSLFYHPHLEKFFTLLDCAYFIPSKTRLSPSLVTLLKHIQAL